MANAVATSSGSERMRTTSAASIATSAPAPIAIPEVGLGQRRPVVHTITHHGPFAVASVANSAIFPTSDSQRLSDHRLNTQFIDNLTEPLWDSRPRLPNGCGDCLGHYNRVTRKRKALAMTDTELSDIARAATTGLSRMPNTG